MIGLPGFGIGGGGYKKTNKAVVVLTYRLVDNETSEIVASGEARGESQRESKGAGGGIMIAGLFAGGRVDMTSSNFAETIIGEAVIDACDKLAADLEAKSSQVGARELDVDARIAAAERSKSLRGN